MCARCSASPLCSNPSWRDPAFFISSHGSLLARGWRVDYTCVRSTTRSLFSLHTQRLGLWVSCAVAPPGAGFPTRAVGAAGRETDAGGLERLPLREEGWEYWQWSYAGKQHRVHYIQEGEQGSPVVLVHGAHRPTTRQLAEVCVRWYGGEVVWWYGGMVVWEYGGTVLQRYGGMGVRYGGTVVWWYCGTREWWNGSMVVRQYGGTVVWWYGSMVVQGYRGTVVRWYVGTGVRWYGGTVVWG